MTDRHGRYPRRQLLAGVGTVGTGLLAGCLDQFRTQTEHSPPEQVSLSVRYPPAEEDQIGAAIASQFMENLERVGIDAAPDPVSTPELYRQLLLEGDYQVAIVRHPGLDDPDALRSLLHSDYAVERGWQNPFGFSEVIVDDLLERQRSSSAGDRESALLELSEHLLESGPFVAVAMPDHVGLVHADLGVREPPRDRIDHLRLLAHEPADADADALRLGVLEPMLGEHFNPFIVSSRVLPRVLELLYAPLSIVEERRSTPWLAESIDWSEESVTISLRPDVSWQDGEPIDAADVVFTYELLQDTSRGALQAGVPPTRFRARGDLIEDIERVDERTVTLAMPDASRSVAERVLGIPVLPAEHWDEHSTPNEDGVTGVLTWQNAEPVGSGPFELGETGGDSATGNRWLRLEYREDSVPEDVMATFDLDLANNAVAELEYRRIQNVPSGIDHVDSGAMDLIVSPLRRPALEEVESTDDVTPIARTGRFFYMLAFNVQTPDVSNGRFRRALRGLLDPKYVLEGLLGGKGRSTDTYGTRLGLAPVLWADDRRDRLVEFVGTDGLVDPEHGRSLFEGTGYRYTPDGELVR